MTALAPVLQFTRWEQTAGAVDPEADIGAFSMSPASAEQVTIQIHTLLDRAWEYIALAYKGRAHVALGYSSWDDYVDARFSDLQLAVPREHRNQVVATLAGARMSVRAIAKLLGVGVATVHREMVRGVVPNETPGGAGDPPMVLGRDGKSYPRERRHAARKPCTMCGDVHDGDANGCPWDLYAQGLGPHPRDGLDPDQDVQPDAEPLKPLQSVNPDALVRRPDSSASAEPGSGTIGSSEGHPVDLHVAVPDETTSLGNLLLESIEALREQIASFAGFVTSFRADSMGEPQVIADEVCRLDARIQELAKAVHSVAQKLYDWQ